MLYPLRHAALLSTLLFATAAVCGCDGGDETGAGGTGGGATSSASSSSASSSSASGGAAAHFVLISNSRGDDIVRFDQDTGAFLGTFVAAGGGGLKAPDAMAFGPDGNLYVSSGEDTMTSAVLRFNGETGAFIDAFAKGGGLARPYGLAFGPDKKLYVSSFLTDQILRYDATTGVFLDVFATGDAKAGGLNGPNGLAFGPDGKLYVATEGSVAVGGKPTFPGLPSQILRYDLMTGQSSVFADQPPLSSAGLGFVSLLGVAFAPGCTTAACDLFVSDYANDLRRYDLETGSLKGTLATNYTGTVPSRNYMGSLAFGADGRLFTVGFDNQDGGENLGVVLRFDGQTGNPLPGAGQEGALLVPSDMRLKRPIGIIAKP